MRIPALRTLGAASLAMAALVFGLGTPGQADEVAIPQLEKHPLADAKPGEWRRVKRTAGPETRFYVERVLGAKSTEGQVFVDLLEVSEDGKQRKAVAEAGRWVAVPKLAAAAGQELKADEMVWLEVNGKKVAARHLTIVELLEGASTSSPGAAPGAPAPARTRTREVWYSNDVLGSGKAKEQVSEPAAAFTTLDWGTMTPADLTKARAEYRLDEGSTPGTPAPTPGQPPSGGSTGACGAACGGK